MNHSSPSTAFLLASLFAGAGATAQIIVSAGGATQATPQAIVTFSADVLHYGAPSGQVLNPRSRVQVYGFPRPGVTIELQVVGARPNVAATFVVSNGWADQVVPGFGRVLVDTLGATTITATTDANGRAFVPLTLPASTSVGDDWFVQCNTIDAGGSSTWELSSAAAFEVGNTTKPIGMSSTLAGTISVQGLGATVTSTNISGVLVREWRHRTVGLNGFVAVNTVTDLIHVNGTAIQDLHVHSGVTDQGTAWTSGNFLTMPAGTAEQLYVGYTAGGVNYGPYAVSGTHTSSLGDVVLNLGPLPANNPLAGATLLLDLDETYVGPEYFQHLDSLGLPASLAAGFGVTGAQVEAEFLAFAAGMQAALMAYTGNRACFTAEIPAYSTFLQRESSMLRALTSGHASTNSEIHMMVSTGLMSADDGILALLFAKICALLDIADDLDGLKEVFDEECGDLAKQMGDQVKSGKYKDAAKTVGKILDKMASEKFAKKLADKVGSSVAKKIIKKVCAGCVPFLGWAWLVGGMIWTLIEQILE